MAQVFTNQSANGVSNSWDANGFSQITVKINSGSGTITLECASRDDPTDFIATGESDLTFTASGVKRFTWDGPVQARLADASSADVDVYLEDIRE